VEVVQVAQSSSFQVVQQPQQQQLDLSSSNASQTLVEVFIVFAGFETAICIQHEMPLLP